MGRRHRTFVAMTAFGTCLTLAFIPATAIAATGDRLPPAAVNNPDIPLSVIESLPEVIQNDRDIVIADDFDPASPIIYPDGTPVEGQSAVKTAAAARCGGTASAGVLGTWGVPSVGGCAIFGSPGHQEVYSWHVMDPTKTVCVQGKGFSAAGAQTWYGIGCGTSRTGVGVRWGNILANPAIRAMSQAYLLGNSVSWHR